MRLPLVALLLAGCGYTSQYQAPVDGRPRAVWRKDAVVVEMSGAPVTPACAAAASDLARNRGPAPPAPYAYTPQWYGPPMVMVHPGIAPPLTRPPLFFSPSMTLFSLAHGGGGGGHGSTAQGLRIDGGSRGGVGKGSTSGAEAALIYVAVVALLTLPIIDMALALAPAEKASASASAIDEVNAFNDLLRWPGSPCSPGAPPLPVEQ